MEIVSVECNSTEKKKKEEEELGYIVSQREKAAVSLGE